MAYLKALKKPFVAVESDLTDLLEMQPHPDPFQLERDDDQPQPPSNTPSSTEAPINPQGEVKASVQLKENSGKRLELFISWFLKR
ncbi:MAG TPA: hypothetical protein V6C97_20885 [Oculatellaceae cyanobacterium]